MMNNKYEDAVSDICRLTLQAQFDAPIERTLRENYYRQVLGDVIHGLAGIDANVENVGVEPKANLGEVREPKQNLDLIPGVRMVHFRGPDYNRFVAVRKHPPMTSGYTQEPNVYEIFVNRDSDIADVMVDGRNLFHIVGDSVGHCTVSKIALSALRRYLKERLCNKRSTKRRKQRLRAAAEGKEA